MEFDNLPENWEKFKLEDIARFQQGKQVELEDQYLNYKEGLIRFVRIVDFTNENELPRYIIAEKSWSSFVNEDDVVMIRYGSQTAGKVVKGKVGIIANNMFRIIPKINNLDNKFLYYFLKLPSVYSYLRAGQSSSTMPAITFGLMSSIKIALPQIEEQKIIASILNAFDEKIQLNNQINKNLEQMAQVLFKSWFVDFEPFLDEEFEETELGLIPKNWRVDTLNKIAKINSKSINPSSETFYNHYSLPSFDDYKYPEIVDGETIKSNKTLMNNNTILLSKLNPRFKRLWLNLDIDNEYKNISSTEFINYEPLEEKYHSYLYFLLDSQYFQDLLNSNATGSTGSRQRVKPKETLDYKVIIPEEEIIIKFHSKISSFIEKIRLNIKENKILEKQRDTLLPKLMSGEIRV